MLLETIDIDMLLQPICNFPVINIKLNLLPNIIFDLISRPETISISSTYLNVLPHLIVSMKAVPSKETSLTWGGHL